ncbi:MAG: LytTR family DNA-binding domain-containing protein [Rikenellaceae bacterium]
MRLKCAIIDDEPLAAMLLKSYVDKTPTLELVATFESAVEAMHSDKLSGVDLIFLDIQMPTLNGLEFSKMVDKPTRIIFTTAFNEYALEGYRVNALDYLVKPISYSDFIEATQKAVEWFGVRSEELPTKGEEYIYVKSEYKLLRIELRDILYVEGLKDYVKFHLEGSSTPILSLMNMKRAEELLPSDDFLRVHRSFIVRKDKIRIVERSRILFGKIAIPVGEGYKSALNDYLR